MYLPSVVCTWASYVNAATNEGTTLPLPAGLPILSDGNAGNNYAISYVPSAATGVITAAPLTVTAQTDSRGYNGTTSSSVVPVLTGTVYGPDAVGTAATQVYDNRNVGGTEERRVGEQGGSEGNAGA